MEHRDILQLHGYGGYDSNECKSTIRYKHEYASNPIDCSFQSPFPVRQQRKLPNAIDPVETQFRRFIQDPDLKESPKAFETPTNNCCVRVRTQEPPRLRVKPIDPVHWDAKLFDTREERYYLKNIVNPNRYRKFLSNYGTPDNQTHVTEYSASYREIPALDCISTRMYGIGRPVDLPERMNDWKRHNTNKLRDSVFDRSNTYVDDVVIPPNHYNAWNNAIRGHQVLVDRDNTCVHDKLVNTRIHGVTRNFIY